MKLNKPLIRKMIKRIETMPESYDQEVWARRINADDERPRPICGTTACLAGHAIICNSVNQRKTARHLTNRSGYSMDFTAARLMGLSDCARWRLFWSDAAQEWPEP